MEKITKCSLCENENLNFLFETQDYNRNFEGAFSQFKCDKCGLIFLNPQPTQKELEKYYSRGKDDIYYSYAPIRKDGFWIKYARFFYKTSIEMPLLNRIALYPFSSLVRGAKIVPKGKHLDVGCGGGQFLYELKRLNPTGKYYGVEPGNFDEKDIKDHGIEFYKGTLEQAHYPDNFFDSITMNCVLEHTNTPSETIQELRRILKPGGSLIIAVPNSQSLAHKIFGKYWYNLDSPRHLFIFSKDTLKRYADRFGFKVEIIRYGSQTDSMTYIFSGIYVLNALLKKDRPLRAMRQKKGNQLIMTVYNMLHFSLSPFTTMINLLGSGDIVEIWLKKD